MNQCPPCVLQVGPNFITPMVWGIISFECVENHPVLVVPPNDIFNRNTLKSVLVLFVFIIVSRGNESLCWLISIKYAMRTLNFLPGFTQGLP